MKTIGILGGMGPEASAEMYRRILRYAQSEYNAIQDDEYPRIIINSIGLTGFDETGVTDELSVIEQLVDGVRTLETAGADVIVIPCNTVHLYRDQMQEAINIPILSIIDVTLSHAMNLGHSQVGVLSSSTVRETRLYSDALEKAGITPLLVDEDQQKELDAVILSVMSHNQGSHEAHIISQIADSLQERGAQSIILGCTELPLATTKETMSLPEIDTTAILVRAVTDCAYQDF